VFLDQGTQLPVPLIGLRNLNLIFYFKEVIARKKTSSN